MDEPIVKLEDVKGTTPPRSNSVSEDRERVEKIIEGKLVKPKNKFLYRFKKEASDTAESVILDIIIPEVKSVIYSSVQEMIGRSLFGEAFRPSPSRSGYTNYNKVNDRRPPASYSSPFSSRRPEPTRRRNFDFQEVILETRADAEDLLAHLEDRILQYRSVSVMDLYDFIGITADYTTEDWGWFNLRNAGIRRVRDGYILDLPRPEALR